MRIFGALLLTLFTCNATASMELFIHGGMDLIEPQEYNSFVHSNGHNDRIYGNANHGVGLQLHIGRMILGVWHRNYSVQTNGNGRGFANLNIKQVSGTLGIELGEFLGSINRFVVSYGKSYETEFRLADNLGAVTHYDRLKETEVKRIGIQSRTHLVGNLHYFDEAGYALYEIPFGIINSTTEAFIYRSEGFYFNIGLGLKF